MITNKELNEVSLSPTKKDYYQIWGELIDLATKISNRWTPDTTNESDPGVVLLKALTAIADKLSYNIDKNTLEAFMPSATQEESMRKLTEMMGYTMHYYKAATCDVTFGMASSSTALESAKVIYFPRFINLKNEEEDVNYVTLEDFTLQEAIPEVQVSAMEGELVECESNSDNIISMVHLDDNKRYILPETNIAENGIFVFSITDGSESIEWDQVDNLNTMLPGSYCYKFGFDSVSGLPYLQFPEDISQIIKDGIRIKYIRTNGVNGNIARGVLVKLEKPSLWDTVEDDSAIKNLTAEDFTVTNVNAATNGANPESLNDAYNNYKKVIGTFDTLVTCRDYMNRIYQLTVSDTNTTPLASNIIVSDIRDDINKATTLCSFNDYGISYSDISKIEGDSKLIEHFDLMLYPFKTIYGLNTKNEYVTSFKYDASNVGNITQSLEKDKTIAHFFRNPRDTDIACIKNYLRLKARIVTTRKVTGVEGKAILENIYAAIYKNFNCRQIDFGEEIPYETIKEVIENADATIKEITLDEPILYTVIAFVNGEEYELKASKDGLVENMTRADNAYNALTLRNILAGRIAAFQYDENFKTAYDETNYPTGRQIQDDPDSEKTWNDVYPNSDDYYIDKMTSEYFVDAKVISEAMETDNKLKTKGLILKDNEVIQFRAPNLKTKQTYPCYVNYFLKLNTNNDSLDKIAIPATFEQLDVFFNENTTNIPSIYDGDEVIADAAYFANRATATKDILQYTHITSDDQFNALKKEHGVLMIKTPNTAEGVYQVVSTRQEDIKTYYTVSVSR